MITKLENRLTLSAPSVLDRILDDHPGELSETTRSMVADLKRHRQVVAKDLQNLLNTRCAALNVPAVDFPNALKSMLTYGITDLSSLSLLSPKDRTRLVEAISIAIERHEPRLTDIVVTLNEPEEFERMLRFRVDAILKIHPNRPPMVFDATLQLSSNAYQINGT